MKGINSSDGVKCLLEEDSWLLIRPSECRDGKIIHKVRDDPREDYKIDSANLEHRLGEYLQHLYRDPDLTEKCT